MTALVGGLGYFQLVLKPQIIKSAISKIVPPPATISAEPAKTEKWIDKLPGIGTLTAIQSIDVTPQVAGVVSAIKMDSGQEVAAGAALIEFDTSVERADLISNQALLRQTELDLVRQNDLSQKAYASQSTLQAAQSKRDAAAAAVDKTKALIAQKTVLAPFAGRLGIRKVDLGQYVSPGTALVSLQALDPIRVDFPVPEQAASQVKVGQDIEVTVDAYGAEVFTGKIEAVDARVSQDTRSLLIRARLPNADRRLVPGMFADVAVLKGAPRAVVTVPRTAVTYSLYGDTIFVAKPAPQPAPIADGAQPAPAAKDAPPVFIADRRAVKVGPAQGDRLAILEGINEGEQVITVGQLKLQPGARVLIDNSKPLTLPTDRPKT